MPDEVVQETELLYRQIGPGGQPLFFATGRVPAIHRAAFLPSPVDTDGLSLIRQMWRTPIWASFRPETPLNRYRLARLSCGYLETQASAVGFDGLGISVTADALDDRFGEPLAHCVASKINISDYKNDPIAKKRIKEWAYAVAEAISEASVLGPFPEPSDDHPYRP